MMQFVISIAMFISSLMGTDFENDWACWKTINRRYDVHEYVCKYKTEDYTLVIGTYFGSNIVLMDIETDK